MTLYKYLDHKHAEAFVSRGEILFRSLLHFLASEDARRDELEGTYRYAPPEGLPITNHTQGYSSVLSEWEMRSAIKYPEEVFVFCSSRALKPDLATKFGADACVEIADATKLISRLRVRLRRERDVKMRTFRSAPVTYYETSAPPHTLWAFPDQIIMNKRAQLFAPEEEYRILFSTRHDVFDPHNANYSINKGPVARVPKGDYPWRLIRLGPMSDCCRVLHFSGGRFSA